MIGSDKLQELAKVAFDSMEAEAPPDAFIGAVLLITEVRIREGDGSSTAFYVHCSDARGWVQRALLEEAATAQVMASSSGPEGA